MRLLGLLCLVSIAVADKKFQEEYFEKYRLYESYVELRGGEINVGSDDPKSLNMAHPPRRATVEPFRILQFPVTNAFFRRFKLNKQRYQTDAEMNQFSYVFRPLLHPGAVELVIDHTDVQWDLEYWMVPVQNIRWSNPIGNASVLNETFWTEPVVHISHEDARSFCHWFGWRLPTEVEWEFAAKAGRTGTPLYPWGDRFQHGRINLWQGTFPVDNLRKDGFYGLAPVDGLPAQNPFELYDMLGNAWEWTQSPYKEELRGSTHDTMHVVKGGSFLDFRDGRDPIRVSMRRGREPHYTAHNLGFRCAQTIYYGKNKGLSYLGPPFRLVDETKRQHHHAPHPHKHEVTLKKEPVFLPGVRDEF